MIFKKAKKPVVHLVDANNWINRAYHATPEMHTSDGTPTNALKGFFNMVNSLYKKITASGQEPYIVICFDIARRKTFRAQIFNEWKKRDPELVDVLFPDKQKQSYKGNRKQDKNKSEDLGIQIELAKEIIDLAGFCWFDGNKINQPVEADDIIGTLAFTLDPKKCLCLIQSRDKDFKQLLTRRRVRLFMPEQANSPSDLYTMDNMFAKDGLYPHQQIEFLMMDGDKVDNIAGVPGCGPATAIKLLDQWGSIKNIIEKAPRIKGREARAARTLAGLEVDVTESIWHEGKEKKTKVKRVLPCPDLTVNRELATIRTDVPGLPTKLKQIRMREPNNKELRKMRDTLEFSNLLWV